ncbi:MAG: leucyl aminopeptidase [Actinomycetia bacterium]|nr:leucyl aminopeptidase [Actinomycetes bacterium]
MSTQPGNQSPTVTVAAAIPKRGTGGMVLIVPVSAGEDGAPSVVGGPFLDAESIGEIEVALQSLGAKAGPEQVTRLHIPSLPVASVLAVGLGAPRDEWPAEAIRRASGAAARALAGVDAVITTLSELHLPAAVEGLILGAYQMHGFRSPKTAPKEPGLSRITALSTASGAKRQAARAVAIAAAVAAARDLVNTPPSHLYPEEFANRAKALGTAAGLKVEILDEKALARGGFGGIVGVGQGSANPPRLVRLTHRGGKGRPGTPKVALIGKGITFDTGGISIKPAAQMHHMTSDMAGAASVIATMLLIADQQVPIDVIATVPMAENMPSATAQRPGDVLTQYGGTTVEVLNTDAEGRLILADAIVRACEDDPDYLIETSTLTGAQVVALGSRIPGVMGSEEFRDRVAALSQREGENGWPMPLPDELKDDLKSTVADLANISSQRFAGMLVAGVFLREFVAEGVQWVHLDIAGPAYNTSAPWGYTPKGGTGVPTRTLFAVLEDIAENG